MKIFLTGITGFVGQNLAWHLAKQGHDIIGLIHDFSPRSLQALQWEPSIVKVHGDVRDFRRMREVLFNYKPDAIVHLAAQTYLHQAQTDPYSTLDVNVNGTISLLSAWRETGRGQFLYFGSDKEYGEGLNRSESDPMRPSEPYGSSKAAADLIAQTYLPNLTITRTCNIYGPGDREQSRLVPGVIQSCLKGEPPNLRNPNARREYIYVDDLCKIVAWLLENRKMGVWNIGSGRVASALEVANLILEHFPNMKLTSNPAPYLEFREQSLNTEKLCGQMDCLAFTTLQAGLRKTYEWWKNEVPCNQRISVSQATS